MSEAEYDEFLALVEICESSILPSVERKCYHAGEGVSVEGYVDPRNPKFYIYIVYVDGKPIAPGFGDAGEAMDAADEVASSRQQAREAMTTETDPVPTEPDDGVPEPKPPGTSQPPRM